MGREALQWPATLVLSMLAAGCGAILPPEPEPPGPTTTVDCSQAVPQPPTPGSALAFLTTAADTIRTYSIQSGCWVRLDEDSGLAYAFALAVHPSGRFLYMSGRLEPDWRGIRVFAVDRTRGTLEQVEDDPLATNSPGSVREMVATGDSLYALTGTIGTGTHGGFWQFSIDPDSGRLDWRGQAFRNHEPSSLEWLPVRSTLYVWTEDIERRTAAVIRALRPDGDGRLSLVDEAPTDWGAAASDPTGNFLWFASDNDYTGRQFPTLDVYRVAPSGALSRTVSAPWERRGPVVHPTGRVLYVPGPGAVEAYRVDPATGRPTLAASIPFAGDRVRLAVDPSGAWLYAVSPDEVRAYRTDSSGSLVERGRVGEGGLVPALVRVP